MDGLVFTPSHLIGLSAQLGMDLTPNDDLEQRLEVFLNETKNCLKDLEQLQAQLEQYACTVKGLDVDELKRQASKLAAENTDGNALR